MKKLLIVNNNMYLGGVQKALLALLWEIHQDCEVTLLLLYRGGPLLDRIPPDVTVREADRPLRYWGMDRREARGRDRLGRALWAGLTRLLGGKWTLRLALLGQRKLRGYDLALSYLHGAAPRTFYGGCNELVLRRVEARRKGGFLHCDFEKLGADVAAQAAVYGRFDCIAACSEGCRNAFLRVLPRLADRTRVVHNCLDLALLRQQRIPPTLPQDKLKVVSVARFGREKGMLRAIRAIAALGSRASMLHCCLIGDGLELPEARRLRRELGLETVLELPGQLPEPYGYMQAADVLLIPSLSEAAPLVIGEAAALGTPILSTETSSAREMVEQPGLGWVVENSEEGIRRGLERLLAEPALLREKKELLRQRRTDNGAAHREFLDLVYGDETAP